MSAQSVPYLTPQQYLEIEEKAEYKSEYLNGQMWPLGGEPYGMAGGRPEHNLISGNFMGELHSALKGKCLVFSADQRIQVGPQGLYTYADCSVVCGRPAIVDTYNLINPRIIVEVLSKTTETNDRGLKFEQYTKLDSLEEYVLVSQTAPRVEKFRRHRDGSWLWKPYDGLEAKVQFESVDCLIALSDVYAGVEF